MPDRLEDLPRDRLLVEVPPVPPEALDPAPREDEKAWRHVVRLAEDLVPVGPTAPAPSGGAASKLLACFDQARDDADTPMYVGGPPTGFFEGLKTDPVRAFFSDVDDMNRNDHRFALNLARMCLGHDVEPEESLWTNDRLRDALLEGGLVLEMTDLPPGFMGDAVGRIGGVKFYPAEFGTGKHLIEPWDRGILTWKRGKNGLSIKITNAFEPDTHKSCPLCMGDGPYEVLEFVVELFEGAFRLNVIERDANGGSRHSRAAIAQTLAGAKGKDFLDGQLFFHDESGQWLGRTTLQGPMMTKHGQHVPRNHVLQVEQPRGDGAVVITHYWDCYGVGGANYALIGPDDEVIGLQDDFATNIAWTEDFKGRYPVSRLVQIPRHAGRNL